MNNCKTSTISFETKKCIEVVPIEDAPIVSLFVYKEFTPCVVYTYYDENGAPIYTGKSIDFYDRHYFHTTRDVYSEKIKYIGLRFYDNPSEMELAELYWIQQLKPEYNRAGKYDSRFINISFSDTTEELVVREDEMVKCWVDENLFIDCAIEHTGINIKAYKRNWGLQLYDEIECETLRDAKSSDDCAFFLG